MRVGDKTIVGPAHHQIADIDDERIFRSRHVHPISGAGVHLQAARPVLAQQNREGTIVSMGAGTQLAEQGRRLGGRIMDNPKGADLFVCVVAEKITRQVEGEREHLLDALAQRFDGAVITHNHLTEFGRLVGVDVLDKVGRRGVTYMIIVGRKVGRAQMENFLEVRRRLFANAVRQALVTDRSVTTRYSTDGRTHKVFLRIW